MKKILSIFLCCAVLFNTLGFIILFSTVITKWKIAIAEELEKKSNAEELIKVTDNATVQHINGHEIIFNGKLYDIACVSRVGDATVLYCYHDTKEENMDAQLANGIQLNTDTPASHSQSPLKSHIKSGVSDYLPVSKAGLPLITFVSHNLVLNNNSFIPQYTLSVQLPPPRG